ncbi:MAG: lipid-A-disaccharide synthase [Deltaproteobacteria bacterium]|nr:lipid-A-disaccharide synthase [Deltaproteobacteria bacterium]
MLDSSEPRFSQSPEASSHRRIMIVAGEASGDLYGADLAVQLRARDPNCEIYGIAGRRMRTVGVRALVNIEHITGLGLAELGSSLWRTVRALQILRAELHRSPPSLLILIDYAEFNLILSGIAHRAGVPVLYYILPQVWAWRRGRVRKLVRRSNRMAVVLPFEAALYGDAGGKVTFVGHPLLDRVAPAQGRAETLARHGFAAGTRLLAILPGSRRGEIRYLLKPLLEAARILSEDHNLVPVIALAPTLSADDLEKTAGADKLNHMHIVAEDTYSIVSASELALVASGTATLETALLGCPMVIVYRGSPLTYFLGRLLVRGVHYFGMPNILAGRRLVPELLQGQVNVTNLVRAAEPMLAEPQRSEIAGALKSLRGVLGLPKAAERVAAMAIEISR